jgi:hypothetical protein
LKLVAAFGPCKTAGRRDEYGTSVQLRSPAPALTYPSVEANTLPNGTFLNGIESVPIARGNPNVHTVPALYSDSSIGANALLQTHFGSPAPASLGFYSFVLAARSTLPLIVKSP